jgi:hypothetical protein
LLDQWEDPRTASMASPIKHYPQPQPQQEHDIMMPACLAHPSMIDTAAAARRAPRRRAARAAHAGSSEHAAHASIIFVFER